MEFLFQPQRVSRVGKYGRLIVKVAEDEGNLMRSDVWRDILRIDSLVQNIQVEHGPGIYRYSDICARWAGACR